MTLLLDIGNTATKCGVLKDNNFSYIGRLYNRDINEDNLFSLLKNVKEVSRITISSVAPKVANQVKELLFKKYSCEIKFVDIKDNDVVNIKIDNEKELGVDLLCDLVAGYSLYGPKTAIVDFGTATKILFIDDNGVFSSCSIFLGFAKSKAILASSAELLPNVDNLEIKPISKCHNTIDVINSSAYYSQLYTVLGIIDKYEKEVGYSVRRVFTGGNAVSFLKELGEENYNEHLLLKGLAILSERK